MTNQGTTATTAQQRGFRPPLDLPPHDNNGSLSCVTANLLYMFGLTEPPIDLWAIDAALGREPGAPMYESESILYLLERGFELIGIGTWSDQRFVGEGLPYLIEYFEGVWDEEHSNFYTPEVVESEQERVRAQIPLFEAFGNLASEECRPPMRGDIEQLLRNGYVVELAIEGESSVVAGSALAYAFDRRSVSLYLPNTHIDTCLMPYSWDYFCAKWLAYDGITGFRLPVG